MHADKAYLLKSIRVDSCSSAVGLFFVSIRGLPREESEHYWPSVTLLPDSNDSTAAHANCSARRPVTAGTGGFSPRLNASNIASK